MADVPKDLRQEIEHLEKLFAVETAKLKEITEHFVKELIKGLTVAGGTIVSSGSEVRWHRGGALTRTGSL